MLLDNLGVPKEVFLEHLRVALNSLDIRAVLNNLEKLYISCKDAKKAKKSKSELSGELDLFFGPSKIFGQIFKLALCK